jgi:hypothetical protein
MALQIKKGTNEQRGQYTPLVGELLYVTDHVQAGVDPIFVGDGVTLGGVAVGQNAVLSGTMEGDIDLFGNNIVGTGNLDFTGNIDNIGTITTKKITITGNNEVIGGESVVIAVDSTGKINHTGELNVTGGIVSSGTIESVSVESDLIGSVISADDSEILVDADTNQFFGNKITLTSPLPAPNADVINNLEISGSSIIFNSTDPLTPLDFGADDSPITFRKFDIGPDERFSKIITEGDGGISISGSTVTTTYKGELSDPDNIVEHDILGAMFYQSFNGKTTGAGATPARQGFAGLYGFIAENQSGAATGVVPATFVVGSGENVGDVVLDQLEGIDFLTRDNNDALKYTSKGVLKIKAIQLRQLTQAQRNVLNSDLASGSMVFVTDPTDGTGAPIGSSRLQLKIGNDWFNVSVTPSVQLPP